MRLSHQTKEKLMLGATAARLAQAADYAWRVNTGRSIIGSTLAILAVDQGDGMVSRTLGVDGQNAVPSIA